MAPGPVGPDRVDAVAGRRQRLVRDAAGLSRPGGAGVRRKRGRGGGQGGGETGSEALAPDEVGATGFEPATARPPAECATRLRHAPKRATGLEPALRAWKALVQPLHHTRARHESRLAARCGKGQPRAPRQGSVRRGPRPRQRRDRPAASTAPRPRAVRAPFTPKRVGYPFRGTWLVWGQAPGSYTTGSIARVHAGR